MNDQGREHGIEQSMATGGARGEPSTGIREAPRRHKRSTWLWILGALAVLAVTLGIGRALLPGFVRDLVNDTLDKNPLYAGRIGAVHIHLWRGAYSIQDVRISKTTGTVPVPLFSAKRVDFAIQWNALRHGKVVGRVMMDAPELNFVDAPTEEESQTGAGGPWLEMIQDLFPFKINSTVIRDGVVHFRAYQTDPPVDVYLSDVQATIDNLGNIRDETKPLISTVRLTALAMDQAKLEYNMSFDPFSYRPTFKMALRLLGLDVRKINDLAVAYGSFDFEYGWFDLVVESEAKEGLISGYAKPLFRELKVLSLKKDIKEDNVLQFFWEAIVGVATSLLKNPPRDQFGTRIPFSGNLSTETTTDILATIMNVLRNAFIRAYLPRLEGSPRDYGGLQFSPPELTDPVSPTQTQ